MAQGDSAGPVLVLVLEDEDSRSTFTDSQAEAVNIIIPEQGLVLAGWEDELGDIGTGELHGISQDLPKDA